MENKIKIRELYTCCPTNSDKKLKSRRKSLDFFMA